MNTPDAYLAAVEYARKKHRDEHDKLIAAAYVAYHHGASIIEIATAAGVHRTTIYRWLREVMQPVNPKEHS